MKQIYILRHADKNKETGELTDEGRRRARELKDKLGAFDLVITSDKNSRLLETAKLLTGTDPTIDQRAGLIYESHEQHEIIGKLAKAHPFTHAGVIYENPEYKGLAEKLGKDLLALFRETFSKLSENGKALIIAQDAVMVAGEKHIKKQPFEKLETNYQPLEGYVVSEDLEINKFTV